eukprot:366111-Chlamydomonas_euryale.AAC.12
MEQQGVSQAMLVNCTLLRFNPVRASSKQRKDFRTLARHPGATVSATERNGAQRGKAALSQITSGAADATTVCAGNAADASTASKPVSTPAVRSPAGCGVLGSQHRCSGARAACGHEQDPARGAGHSRPRRWR